MKLDNETLLGSYLSHLHGNVRQLAQLDFQYAHHPDVQDGGPPVSETRRRLMDCWEELREALHELLQLQLKPFNQLTEPGPCHTGVVPYSWRYNFAMLKRMADKHRRKNPDFTFLQSWDLVARKRTEEERLERSLEFRHRRGW